jgi:hypothetical protein
MLSPIIYQNLERDIILIDIPTSIAAAQGRSQDVLLSTAPLEAPIEPKEDYRPKTQKAKANKAQEMADSTHAEYKILVEHALAQIHAQVSGPWCAPRKLLMTQKFGTEKAMEVDEPSISNHNRSMQSSGSGSEGIQASFRRPAEPEKELESRMREWAAWSESKDGDDTALKLQQMMASLGAISEATDTAAVGQDWVASHRPARESTSSTQVAEAVTQEPAQETEPWISTFHNPNPHSLELTLSGTKSLGPEYRFTVPPHSTLFLSDSTASDTFRTSFRTVTADYNLPRHFDLGKSSRYIVTRLVLTSGRYVKPRGSSGWCFVCILA